MRVCNHGKIQQDGCNDATHTHTHTSPVGEDNLWFSERWLQKVWTMCKIFLSRNLSILISTEQMNYFMSILTNGKYFVWIQIESSPFSNGKITSMSKMFLSDQKFSIPTYTVLLLSKNKTIKINPRLFEWHNLFSVSGLWLVELQESFSHIVKIFVLEIFDSYHVIVSK